MFCSLVRQRRRILVLTTLLGMLGGCSNNTNAGLPPAFRRPSDLAFVCFETIDNRPSQALRLSACRIDPDSGDRPKNVALYALVTQQTRGQIAAVDITNNPPRIIDTDRRVPGFTFLPTGEVPVAIAVSGRAEAIAGDTTDPHLDAPTCVFVANRGSKTLQGLPISRFLGTQTNRDAGISGDVGISDDAAIGQDGGLAPKAQLANLDAAPAGLVFSRVSSEEQWVFVTYPDASRIERRPVDDDCNISSPDQVWDLSQWTPLPDGVVATDPEFDFARVCPGPNDPNYTSGDTTAPSNDPLRDSIAAIPSDVAFREFDETAALAAAPTSIEVDGQYILVGDRNLPVLYRIDRTAAAPAIERLRTDGPIHDFAVTEALSQVNDQRFVYAIDESDRSVMVMRYVAPVGASATLELLPISSNLSGDPTRISFRGLAESVAIVDSRPAPSAQGAAACAVDSNPPPAASVLRGVFATVGFLDGTVRFVDIVDLDRDCRAEADTVIGGACEATTRDRAVFIRRHSPRVFVTNDEPVALAQAPEVNVDQASFRYDSDGTASDGTPRLGCVGEVDANGGCSAECPPDLGRLFPDEGDPLICGVTDPWSSNTETWAAIWEGAIPGTRTNAGRLVRPTVSGGAWRIETPIDLCIQGVLPGDQVAIVGALPTDTQADSSCQQLLGTNTGGVARPILLSIQAFERIADGPYRWSLTVGGTDERFGEIERCYLGELLTIDIRANDQFVVTSSLDGFLHDVVEQGGACVTRDPSAPSGRVDDGELFRGPRLQLRFVWPDAARNRSAISFTVGTVPSELNIPVSATSTGGTPSLPIELQWLGMDGHLYVLDQFDRGMLQYSIEPLRANWVLER